MKAWICTTLSNFFGPMQGAARLYAYTKKSGHDVCLKDFNQDAYFTLLSRPYLENTFQRLKYMLDPAIRTDFLRKNLGSILQNSSNNSIKRLLTGELIKSSHNLDTLSRIEPFQKIISTVINSKIKNDNIYYALLAHGPQVINEVERAREALDKNFYNLGLDSFIENFSILLCGKAIIDAAYFPGQLDFGFGFHGTIYEPSTSDILRAVQDEKFNFLIPYFSQEVIPQLEREKPQVVGISITHTAEFIPVFTLASLIKRKFPEVHICLGGSTLTEVAYKIEKNRLLWEFFDSMILGPGEYAFGNLLEQLEKGENLQGVPNLVYKENNTIRKSEKSVEFDLNDALTPEFTSLRPGQPLPLEASSGCYWGKCMFCYYPKMGLSNIDATLEAKRVRKINLVIEDMNKLQERYKPLYIGFTDSALHPERLKEIAEYNKTREKKIKFSAFVRFEKEFKSKEFCRFLAEGGLLGGQVGLESGSQRTNDTINKGVKVTDAKIILKNFYAAGILMHIYSIVGVPGETMGDAVMTYKFIKKMRKFLTLDWQIYSFYVLERGPLAQRQEELGLKLKPLPDDFLVQVTRYEVKQGLTQEDSVALAIKYYEKLKKYMHPLCKIMDIESCKGLIIGEKSRK